MRQFSESLEKYHRIEVLRFESLRRNEKKLRRKLFPFTFLILQKIFNVWFANESSQSKDDHEYSEKNRKILLHALVQTFGSYFCSDGLRGSLDKLELTYVYNIVMRDMILSNVILIRNI